MESSQRSITTQRQMILDHHQETRTITQTATFDLNYGITDRLGLRNHDPLYVAHASCTSMGSERMEQTAKVSPRISPSDGIGDMRVGVKYNVLPTLRSMVVLGFGVYLPTGDHPCA